MYTFSSKFDISRKAIDGSIRSICDVWKWIENQQIKQSMNVELISLDEMEGWSINSSTGNMIHGSRRFFSITGME